MNKLIQVSFIVNLLFAIGIVNFLFWYNKKKDIHYYFIENKLHRKDGPAVERSSGHKEWWHNGELFYIEHFNGTKIKLENGKIHNEDGHPTIEYSDGSKVWCKNGELHRENGPALVPVVGECTYWLDGVKLSKRDYDIIMKLKSDAEKYFEQKKI